MAIYRSAGYTGNLVREMPEVPVINTPEKGEPLILKALNYIEDYAKTLTVTSNRLALELKNRVEKTADVASDALKYENKYLNDFSNITKEEIDQFDLLMENVETLCEGLKVIDQLYDDVLHLSDLLTSLE